MIKPITIFISYAHEDASYLGELQKFLKPYERKRKISVWADKAILPGELWDDLIKNRLKESEIILFLVSPDFIASEYINNTEIKIVVESDRFIKVPIIIRPIELDEFELNKFNVLPNGAKPVAKWENKDEAWVDVISTLKRVFNQLNGVAIGESENGYGNIDNNRHAKIAERVNSTDKLFVGLTLFIIFIGIVALVFGLVVKDDFYRFTAFAAIGIGLIGYFLSRKFAGN